MSHLVLEEAVLQGFVARVAASSLEQQLILLAVESDVTSRQCSNRFGGKNTLPSSNAEQPHTHNANTHGVEVGHGLDLLVVVRPGQLSKAFWVKLAAVREEFGPVLLGQLRAERVDGDDEGSPVGLELRAETGGPSGKVGRPQECRSPSTVHTL